MKIAFQVEGLSDEIVVPIFVRRILGREIEAVFAKRRPGGVHAVKSTLEKTSWNFWRDKSVGLVVAMDNDGRQTLHVNSHSTLDHHAVCNYCELVSLLPKLPEQTPFPPFKFAIGVAVQALESWLLADGKLPGPPESFPQKTLKVELYKTAHPTRAHFEKYCRRKAETIEFDILRKQCPSFVHFENSVKTLAS